MTSPQTAAGFEFGSLCDVGVKRRGKTNQDSIELVLPAPEENFHPLLIVADGMGGYNGGEIASKLTAKTIRGAYLAELPTENYVEILERYVHKAHQALREYAKKDSKLGGMGTTLAMALLTPDEVYIFSVGDSRVYLFRDEKAIRLSQDQSWVAAQVRAGFLTTKQARHHPKKNRLTMSLSARRPDVKVYSASAKLGKEDIILLCSDGLWGVVPDSLMQAVAFELPPQEAAEKLVALANAGQGPDNISVIIARREGATLKSIFAGGIDETNP